MKYTFKMATTKEEFAQIAAMNYRTFVKEIPQHEKNEREQLVDRFHQENTYFIAKDGHDIVGMIAIRDQRPFSLDSKIGTFEQYLSFPVYRPVEIRLLAVDETKRNGRIFLGLIQLVARYCLRKDYDIAVISGTTRQEKLYRHIGFEPFAWLVGTAEAAFQPMYMTKELFEQHLSAAMAVETISFLPGPTVLYEEAKRRLVEPLYSHRSGAFEREFEEMCQRMIEAVNGERVAVLSGSGSVANECIAWQLKQLGRGLVISNGEFGERLAAQATATELSFVHLRYEWGEPFRMEQVRQLVDEHELQWIWCTHVETSTGMLNPLEELKEIRDVQLAIDCISSFSCETLDLTNVAFAAVSSGKGLRSLAGLAYVFYQQSYSGTSIPRYFDLRHYERTSGIPFTISSLLMMCASVASRHVTEHRLYERQQKMIYLLQQLAKVGIAPLLPERHQSHAIVTIPIPLTVDSVQLGEQLFLLGYHCHYESSYLRQRNWLQLSIMNDVTEQQMKDVVHLLALYTTQLMEQK